MYACVYVYVCMSDGDDVSRCVSAVALQVVVDFTGMSLKLELLPICIGSNTCEGILLEE